MIAKLVVVLAVATAAFGTPIKRFDSSFFPTGGKIVGGSEAAAGEIPWQVSIQYTFGFQSCGASIIGNEWIVTAAHCSDINPSSMQVRAGTLTYAQGGSVHTIEEIIVHEDYRTINDIAVWRIAPAFNFDSNTGAAALPAQGTDTPAGTVITVSGWGTTSSGGSVSEELLKVDIPIVSKADCSDSYSNLGEFDICAGLPEGGVDSCQGDSGGPLFRDGVLLGVVSRGNGCAFPGYPGIYTEVAGYRDWIMTNTGI